MTMRYRCDLAVMGAGLAGFAAAVRAAEQGLSVLVFEKLTDAQHICNSRLTGGIFHVALHGLVDPPALIAERIRNATGGTAEPALVDAVSEDALRLVRWLQLQGIRFMKSGREPWQDFTLAPPALPQFGRQWKGRAGDVMLLTLEARLGKHDGRVLRGHRATRLAMQDGRCTGLEGEAAGGTSFSVDAGAVVVADGGFQASHSLLCEHITPQPAHLKQRNAQTGMGDALSMARAVGACSIGIGHFYGHLLSRTSLDNDALWPFPWADDLARSSIVVGSDGHRIADEGIGGVYLANQIAKLPDPASTFVIFDDATWNGPGRLRAMSANPYMTDAGGKLYSASTLSELAAISGLPQHALAAEVESYNAAIAANDLARLWPPRSEPKSAAWPIRTGPFHALPIVPGITYTMGGIRIDGDSRVLDTNGSPIAGLYAAGAATGGLEGGPRSGYVGGLIKAGVTGLRASEHIAGKHVAGGHINQSINTTGDTHGRSRQATV
ncbi:MAG: FAD-binding protein [Bdellovibrionales bacterium]|nr:FAD-binding protein [Ramlibacter sp.]